MENWKVEIESLYPWVQPAVGALLIGFGWVLYRFGIVLLGFFLGAVGGLSVAQLAARMVAEIPETWWVLVIGVLVGGFAGMILLRGFYFLGVFIVSGLWAWNVKTSLLNDPWVFKRWSLPSVEQFWTSNLGTLAFAVVVALMIIVLHRFIVIVLTSGVGALMIGSRYPVPGLVYLLFVGGIMVQLGLMKQFGIDTGRETVRWKQERAGEDDATDLETNAG